MQLIGVDANLTKVLSPGFMGFVGARGIAKIRLISSSHAILCRSN